MYHFIFLPALTGQQRQFTVNPAASSEFPAYARENHRPEIRKFEPEEGIVLPALWFIPEKPKSAAIYLHEDGKAAAAAPGGAIERLVQAGTTVLAVDLPGMGQTVAKSESGDAYMAYLLGRSYVGLRAENILVAARWLKEQTPPGQPAPASPLAVCLIAVGHAAIPALHAVALEPDLFQSATFFRMPPSWAAVVHARLAKLPISDVVHGALATYDLPDLAATLGAKVIHESAP